MIKLRKVVAGLVSLIPIVAHGQVSSDVASSATMSITPHRSVDDYMPPVGITKDALSAFNAAIAAVQRDGGGTLALGRRGYLIEGGNLVIPRNVRLQCDAPTQGEQYPDQDWLAVPCLLLINPAHTVQISQQAGLDGVTVLREGWAKPTSMRTAVQMLAAYSGTAITAIGSDSFIQRTTIIGFNQCLTSSGFERIHLTDVYGDCNNGAYLDQSLDISRFTRVHFWPFAVGHVAWSNNGIYRVTGLANNGSGLIRAVFAPGAEAPVTGDIVALSGVFGVPQSARRRYTVTVIDSSHMDLNGSVWPGTFKTAASSINGKPTLTDVTDASGLGLGMAMAGGNFPEGSTIVRIAQVGGAPGTVSVTMSNNANSTVSRSAYDFVPITAAGGQGAIDLGYRPGRAFSWTNGQNNSCTDCFEFGYRYGYYIGHGAQWTQLTGSSADSAEMEDPDNFGILLDTGAADTIVTGGYVSGYGHALYVASGPGPANKVIAVAFNVGSQYTPSIQFESGPVTLVGCTLAYLPLFGGENGSVAISGGVSDVVILSGNDFGTAPVVATNAAARDRVVAAANQTGGGP